MKAWVLHGIGDLRLGTVPDPEPKDGEILVKVRMAGICSSDVRRVYSDGAYHYPLIPGHEFSGVTPDGTRVGVFPLLPCRACESCISRSFETCSDYGYLGSRQDGGFAELVAVREWNLVRLPDSMTFEQAALLEPAAVALHAARRIDLSSASSVAVVGDGAIGRLIANWVRLLSGAEVGVFGRGDTPPRDCYDACFEAAGAAGALRRCIELARPNGQLVLVGNPDVGFSIDQKLYWQILRKQLAVKGAWNSSYPADWHETIKNADALQLDSIVSHRYEFGGLGSAFEMMHGKGERHGKVIAEFF